MRGDELRAGEIDGPLLSGLYESALCDGDWQPALERFRCLSNSAETAFTAPGSDPMGIGINLTGTLISPEARHAYFQHYIRLDPKLPILAHRQPGFLFNDVWHFDEVFVRRDSFYQEYSRPLGSRHTLHMVLCREGEDNVYLAAMRSDRQGPYEAETENLFRQIGRHFLRAAKLRHTVEEARILRASAQAALDRLRLGVVVLDDAGRVLVANAAAEIAAVPGDELQLRQGRLSARSPRIAQSLETLTRSALREHAPAVMLSVPRADGGNLTLWIARLPPHTMLSPNSRPAVLVTIADSRREIGLNGQSLVALYGLTRAEAELALTLTKSATLVEAARALRIKISTARTQMLSILRKTGARRQIDLIQMLCNLPGAQLESDSRRPKL